MPSDENIQDKELEKNWQISVIIEKGAGWNNCEKSK